ncbi:MAG: nickel pincer cofactor biosynthesis protein LarB, partial [Acidobacteriota bacterium]
MKSENIRTLLEKLAAGDLDIDGAVDQLAKLGGIDDMGFAQLDTDRGRRTGMAEVIFSPGKTTEQLEKLIERSLVHHGSVLITRLEPERAATLVGSFENLHYNVSGRILATPPPSPAVHPTVAVVCAGTSDLPVAEEAAATLEHFGHEVDRINDVGVAGIHRLFGVLDRLKKARAVIVVAGMEGALPSVVAGLISRPVVAVPTSVGYGASFGGIAALLGMLHPCASGVTVLNIDNGFGAAFA